MNNYQLSQRSLNNLAQVHHDLIQVVKRALILSKYDFIVIEGKRTLERQKELLKQGTTKTLNSRHLTGHAVDIVPFINGAIPWQDWSAFESISSAMKQAARELNIALIWGGDWVSFRDGPHYELCRDSYP